MHIDSLNRRKVVNMPVFSKIVINCYLSVPVKLTDSSFAQLFEFCLLSRIFEINLNETDILAIGFSRY